jgi:hypothetical protein
MLELFKSMLTGQNAFASGGLMLMIIGGLSVYLRAVPEKIWYWIVRQTTMLITVNDDDAALRLVVGTKLRASGVGYRRPFEREMRKSLLSRPSTCRLLRAPTVSYSHLRV